MSHVNETSTQGKYAFNSPITYDFLKDTALIYLPALGALYFALAAIWGLPAAEQVVGTITAVDVFLGIVLKISKTSYDNSDKSKDGSIDIVPTEGLPILSDIAFNDPKGLEGLKTVTLEVNQLENDGSILPPENSQ